MSVVAMRCQIDNGWMTVSDEDLHDGAVVVSVHVGRPRTVSTRRTAVMTAIWKDLVEGRVAVRGVNLDGDDQADRSVHGGPDKAVYAYSPRRGAYLGERTRTRFR